MAAYQSLWTPPKGVYTPMGHSARSNEVRQRPAHLLRPRPPETRSAALSGDPAPLLHDERVEGDDGRAPRAGTVVVASRSSSCVHGSRSRLIEARCQSMNRSPQVGHWTVISATLATISSLSVLIRALSQLLVNPVVVLFGGETWRNGGATRLNSFAISSLVQPAVSRSAICPRISRDSGESRSYRIWPGSGARLFAKTTPRYAAPPERS